MKNQYVGDINDYRKYGLLRILTGFGAIPAAVCWMLTDDDDRPDGRKLGYLQEPEKWRGYDPDLYGGLQRLVNGRKRSIAAVENASVLPGAVFHSELLVDDKEQRRRYFENLAGALNAEIPLVFFDPDNGLEITSVRRGNKESCRYLYLDEVAHVYTQGRSVLVYQHFPRRKRQAYIAERAAQLRDACGAPCVMSFTAGNVVFLLVARESHAADFETASERLLGMWGGEFKVSLDAETK